MLCLNPTVHLAVIDIIYKRKTIIAVEDKTYEDEGHFFSDTYSNDFLGRVSEAVI